MRIWLILGPLVWSLSTGLPQSATGQSGDGSMTNQMSELREKILEQLLDPTMMRTIADIITIGIQDKTVSGMPLFLKKF